MKRIPAEQLPVFSDILTAKQQIESNIRATPVLSELLVNKIPGCDSWLKCENLQRGGAIISGGNVDLEQLPL